MNNEMFEIILEKDEEIKWSNGINVGAHIKRNLFQVLLLGLFPPCLILTLGISYGWLLLLLSLLNIIPLWIGIAHFIFSTIVIICFILFLDIDAKNTYFCITNKRIIKRSGVFNNKFTYYPYKNIENVDASSGIFDKKGKNASANLFVSVRNSHVYIDGKFRLQVLQVSSLNNAYEAYKTLNEIVNENNKTIKVNNKNKK